jgi:hypothetical protein
MVPIVPKVVWEVIAGRATSPTPSHPTPPQPPPHTTPHQHAADGSGGLTPYPGIQHLSSRRFMCCAGHAYYFLEDVYPHMTGRRLLKTPGFVRALFPADEPIVAAPAPPEQQAQGQDEQPGGPAVAAGGEVGAGHALED